MPSVLRATLAILTALTALTAAPARAQDSLPADYNPAFGTMWTFDAPPLAYWQARYGFAPDSAWLENVRLASIRLPNCSASFVSSSGLVMTNHHCARACISGVSPADTNYQTAGFTARTLEEEKRCEGLYVDQLTSIEDVTSRVRDRVTARSSAEQVEQREQAIREITEACSAGAESVCQVVAFYQGGMYSLYRFTRFGDVRLVMAPEESISFFGGDPDNFTFPRFALDVTFLRVYQDGRPYRPANYLRWNDEGPEEGDLVFVTGNPGSTGRLLTMAQLEYLRDVSYPFQLELIARNIRVYKELSGRSEAARRQYENQVFSLENAQKAITGYHSGLVDSALMAQKAGFEDDFRRRVAADPRLAARYGGAWDSIAAAQRELSGIHVKNAYYGVSYSSPLNLALGLVRLPAEAALPDSARLPQYRGEGLASIRNILLRPIQVDTALERRMLEAQFTAARDALGANDPFVQAVLQGGTPAEASARLLAGTRVADTAFRRELVEGGARALEASRDPMIQAARRINAVARPIAMQAARLNTGTSANAERIGEAIFAAYGKSLPPDATFTLRISDGVVKSYPNNGTITPWRTSYYGLYGRAANFGDEAPFRLPARWRAAEDSLDLSVALNFVSTNDIIGGNSGSPVIDRDARVVGLIFDSNIQGLPNRFAFTDETARSVSVHSRGITEALRKVYGAGRIADELVGTP
jgi:hypothetical protein